LERNGKKMSKEEIFEKLNEVFRDVFDREDITVCETTTAADIEEWDSLRHITLMEYIEDEFDIRFKMAEINGMKNVGEMVEIILKRISV